MGCSRSRTQDGGEETTMAAGQPARKSPQAARAMLHDPCARLLEGTLARYHVYFIDRSDRVVNALERELVNGVIGAAG